MPAKKHVIIWTYGGYVLQIYLPSMSTLIKYFIVFTYREYFPRSHVPEHVGVYMLPYNKTYVYISLVFSNNTNRVPTTLL